MYVRFFFFLGENSVNYLPEDSFVFFFSRSNPEPHVQRQSSLLFEKKYTRVWIHESVGPRKTTKSSRRKRGRMVLSARACARYMTD